MRGSLDQAAQTPALQWLSAFRHLDHLVLWQINWCDGDKNNEIAAAVTSSRNAQETIAKHHGTA
ncbi:MULTISPECIES: hypothetical protein [Chromobacterium]|uniref:hypothetical protein n=1 Tax=Chromobacterium TaxID=535 RepID=UPI001D060DA9|nr:MULTISPECIES: hypothetical protein [Chromobacterium]UJB32725.1 hypothetical protein HQN78_17715 [Chromobacterium sp. Beijing]